MRLTRRGTFLYRSFMTALIVACLPTLLIGVLSYTVGVRQIESEVFRTNTLESNNAYQQVDEEFERLETIFAQWAFNPVFDETLRGMDLRDRYDRTHQVYSILLQMKSSNSFVKDVYLYLRDQNVTIADHTGVMSVESAEEKAEYMELLQANHTIFWTNKLEQHALGKNTSRLSLVIRVPGGSVDSFGALIVSFEDARIASLIGERYDINDGAALLLREDGEIIAASNHSANSDIRHELQQYVRTERLSGMNGSEVLERDGKRYVVAYNTMSRANEKWIYATAYSFETLITPVKWTSRFIILAGLVGVLIAVLLSWIASHRLAKPLHQLLGKLEMSDTNNDASWKQDEFEWIAEKWSSVTRESRHLQVKLDSHLPSLREGFLLQLVQGHFNWLREYEIRSRMEQIGWETSGRQYGVMLCKLYGLGRPESRFGEGDEQLVTFAAVNIASELLTEQWPESDVINFQDLSFGILFPAEESSTSESVRAEMFRIGKLLTDILHTSLKVDTVLVVAKPSRHLSELPEAVEDAWQALRGWEWKPGSEVIGVEDLLPSLAGRMSDYPFDEEKAVIQALRMGRLEDTDQAIQSFFKYLVDARGGSGLHITQSAAQLLSSIMHTVMQGGVDPYELMEEATDNPYEQVLSLPIASDAESWLMTWLVRPYISKLETEYNVQVKRLVQQAVDLLHSEYKRELSLEECSDRLGTYPQKLSIAFKQVTGFNYIDYLTKLRLDKAKEMLAESDLKVNEIAEAVGYQPSYFNRIFKKHEGVTPGQYRDQKQI
jgi:AraC-like DNA-binding protein